MPAGRTGGAATMWGVARYLALFRGINVGGHRKIPMSDLRVLVASLGFSGVETYLQSGNALFTTERPDTAALAAEMEEAIATRLGLDVKVLVRSRRDLAEVVAGNPFPEVTADPSKLHVAFLSAAPDAGRAARLDPDSFAPERFRLDRKAVYLWYPNGAGRAKLTNDVLERRLGVTATSRNWNTVVKLLELLGPEG